MHLTSVQRVLVTVALTTTLTAIALPAQADVTPSVAVAQQNLAHAQQQAHQASTALGAAQQQLAGAQQQLAAVEARITALDSAVALDAAHVAQLNGEVSADKSQLSTYVRSLYKSGGSTGALAYIINAYNVGDAFQRAAEMDRVNQAGRVLLDRIAAAEAASHRALAQATAARRQAGVAREQAATAEAVVAVQADQLQTVVVAANTSLSSAGHQLNAAVSAAQAAAAAAQAAAQAAAAKAAAAQAAAGRAAAAAAAAAAARSGGGGGGTVYVPVSGAAFTVDTNLTLPSGLTAGGLDSFLTGSALAGLGPSFLKAETTYHVSARYFVAHAILESAWGTSAIAQDKHNLFGYGANDANPYGNAMSFASFDACIQFVAQMVARNYLSPSGPFFHGPTLRGMNVSYASDPFWADKIAVIAGTIPS